MATRKKTPPPPPAPPATGRKRRAALDRVAVLMLYAPRISGTATPHDEDARWLVDRFDIKRGAYRAVGRTYPLREALRVLRSELNQHVIELRRLADLIFGETP